MKVHFTTTILKFNDKGEKSGWTYIDIPADVAQRLKRGNKKSFRVKGKLDDCSIEGIALLPMGGGDFIMPLNAAIRKALGKRHGAMLRVQLEEDTKSILLDTDFMECLEGDTVVLAVFKKLPKSHQQYFSKWIASAKTEVTKAKRIAQTLNGLSNGLSFSQMMKASKTKT